MAVLAEHAVGEAVEDAEHQPVDEPEEQDRYRDHDRVGDQQAFRRIAEPVEQVLLHRVDQVQAEHGAPVRSSRPGAEV